MATNQEEHALDSRGRIEARGSMPWVQILRWPKIFNTESPLNTTSVDLSCGHYNICMCQMHVILTVRCICGRLTVDQINYLKKNLQHLFSFNFPFYAAQPSSLNSVQDCFRSKPQFSLFKRSWVVGPSRMQNMLSWSLYLKLHRSVVKCLLSKAYLCSAKKWFTKFFARPGYNLFWLQNRWL